MALPMAEAASSCKTDAISSLLVLAVDVFGCFVFFFVFLWEALPKFVLVDFLLSFGDEDAPPRTSKTDDGCAFTVSRIDCLN